MERDCVEPVGMREDDLVGGDLVGPSLAVEAHSKDDCPYSDEQSSIFVYNFDIVALAC